MNETHIFTRAGGVEIINLQLLADGSTYEMALENVQVIIDEWIETARKPGREVPEPKGKLMYA